MIGAILLAAALTAQPHYRSEVTVSSVTLHDGRRIARVGITGLLVDGMDRAVAAVVAAATSAGADTLEVAIDSPGGAADVGASVYATLASADVVVRCLVTGSASSMAFVILQACDDRASLPGAKLVIHRPYDIFLMTGQRYHSDRLRELADELDTTQAFMVGAMVDRGGLPAAIYHERLSLGDWRMSPEEAIVQKFLDRVVSDRAEFVRSVEGPPAHKKEASRD